MAVATPQGVEAYDHQKAFDPFASGVCIHVRYHVRIAEGLNEATAIEPDQRRPLACARLPDFKLLYHCAIRLAERRNAHYRMQIFSGTADSRTAIRRSKHTSGRGLPLEPEQHHRSGFSF
jgi:hypothetical protein